MLVYHIGSRPPSSQAYVLDRNAGIVLGKVFERPANNFGSGSERSIHDVTFGAPESQKVQQTNGKHLVEAYWGRYVALLRDHDGTNVRILRDPTGALPCQLTRHCGINIVFSNIEDCAALGLINTSINWDHIAAYMWFHRLVTDKTGLDAVRQIQAGECVKVGSDETEATFYWRPDEIHRARIVEDRQQAMRELRTAIKQSVAAWASCYNSILLELSGGLDSSVVAASLARASTGANILCENYYTQNSRGDERVFAQKAAHRAGVELIETPLLATTRSLKNMLPTAKLATPAQTCLVPEAQLLKEQLVQDRGIEVVFSGQGGDHFFQSVRTRLIAADYAWRHGLRPGLLRVITDTSRFTRKPFWSVVAATIEFGLLRRAKDPYGYRVGEIPPLVAEATCNALDLGNIRHTWVDDAKDLPGAKRQQVFEIVDSQNFHHIPSPCEDRVHPLISQPIIELCLQIPSYILTYGGIDRALVRDAFASMLPPEVIARTAKGATTSFASRLLVGDLPFVREYLLDGLLVAEQVLDREKTEAALTESHLTRDPHLLFPVVNSILAENWLRTWVRNDQRAAA